LADIVPTIGRKIWYWPAPGEGVVHDPKQAFDATVVCVHGHDRVNLAVKDHDGSQRNRGNVVLWNGVGDEPSRPYAAWMPYQKGQAAKTEAAEAAKSKE
jgi:hypothetical protein